MEMFGGFDEETMIARLFFLAKKTSIPIKRKVKTRLNNDRVSEEWLCSLMRV
jgi:hypothetical protein